MDGQSIVVYAIVAVAAAILLRRVFSLKRREPGCGMGCSGCSHNTANQSSVTLVQLGAAPNHPPYCNSAPASSDQEANNLL